jgi:outer membrane protein OmpA-like peptidoglycan-associated protein
MFRKSILILSLVVPSLATGCTTRYQDMLRDRDQRISELGGDVARLRSENDELQSRLSASPAPAPAAEPARPEGTMLEDLNDLLGDGANARIVRNRISIGVKDSVTFDSGSTTLKETSHRTLRSVADVLRSKFAGRRYYIEGHTDTDPILSVERADSVARYLISQGVPESAIVVVGYGQYDPSDSRTKANNRRVEIVVGEKF